MTKRPQGTAKAKLPVPGRTNSVRSKKRPPAKVTRWGTDWSWPKMIGVLSKPDEARQERLSAARDLLGLQEDGFRKLREAIEDPSRLEVSWESPFLEVYMEFPYEWDTEVPLSEVDATDSQRNLLISLSILTAGAAVQPEEGGPALLIPLPLCNVVRGFDPKEKQTCLNAWLDRSAVAPRSFGDNHLEDPHDRTLQRKGPRGADFAAALNFFVSPRLIDHKRKKSGFAFLIGVPWEAEEAATPRNWSQGERSVFWEVISRFLLTLQEHVENPDAAPSEIVEPVKSRGSAKDALRFVASVKNSQGVSYFEKARVPEISETGLACVPDYARGGHGPVLDITDGKGQLKPSATSTVLATMFHPDDEARRKELLAGFHLQTLEGFKQHFSQPGSSPEKLVEEWSQALALAPKVGLLPVGLFEVLGSAPSKVEAEERIDRALPDGMLAGELLLFILNCHAHGEPIGVTQALRLFALGLAEGRIDLGPLRHRKRSAMLNAWKTYKPVAHLWAAYRMWVFELEQDPDFALVPGTELNFLAAAEELRGRGESCFARAQKRKKGPVLDPTTTWRPPPDLVLPSVDVAFPPLPKWSREQLGKQARPARRPETPRGTHGLAG